MSNGDIRVYPFVARQNPPGETRYSMSMVPHSGPHTSNLDLYPARAGDRSRPPAKGALDDPRVGVIPQPDMYLL